MSKPASAGFCFLDHRACVTTIANPSPSATIRDPAPAAPPTVTIAARAAHIFGNRASLTAFFSRFMSYPRSGRDVLVVEQSEPNLIYGNLWHIKQDKTSCFIK